MPVRSSAPEATDASRSTQQQALPLPPDLPAAPIKGSAVPTAAANGAETLPPQPGAQATSTTAALAESHPAEHPHGRIRRVFVNDKAESQGHTAVAPTSDVAAKNALQQQLSEEAGKDMKTKTAAAAGAAAVASAAATGKPSDAVANTPAHSFDGRQSFISLEVEVEEAPAHGTAPVDQPLPASRKAPPVQQADKQEGNPAELLAVQQAVMDAGLSKPAGAVHASHQRLQQQQGGAAPAALVLDAAEAEVDKQAIRPDLFTASRPSSAVSQGPGGPHFQAGGDQKQLPAAKSKAAAKGNIQIVLATKHKQVLPMDCSAL